MNCYPLPNTGVDANTGLFLLVAIGCLVLGAVLVLATRRGRRHTGATAALTVLSLVVAAFVLPPGAPAQATTSDCETAGQNSLTVRQTSIMDGLAPGRAPVAITGVVVNNSVDSTYITAVDVRITAVSTQPGAAPGTCDPSDYFLLNPRMSVEQPVGPGGSTSFAGASIGLGNKPTNQDACQRAVIHLLYTANPAQAQPDRSADTSFARR